MSVEGSSEKCGIGGVVRVDGFVADEPEPSCEFSEHAVEEESQGTVYDPWTTVPACSSRICP